MACDDQFSLLPSRLRPSTSAISSLTTYLYRTNAGLFSLAWSQTFLGRSLHLQLHDESNASLNECRGFEDLSSSASQISFRLDLKPLFFWRKSGSRKYSFCTGSKSQNVQIFWNLTRAKFGLGPEPVSGFYIAVVVNSAMTLLVGDLVKEAYSRPETTRNSKGEKKKQTLILRREHVFGNRIYTTKAKFGSKTREITIEFNIGNGNDPRLRFSADGKKFLQVKRLKWKFRGHERIQIDGVPVDVSWDVYRWMFGEIENGHAVFMFRFEEMELSEEIHGGQDGNPCPDDENVMGLRRVMSTQKRTNESNGFVLCGGFERRRNLKRNGFSRAKSLSSSSLSSSTSCNSSVMEWARMEERELEEPSGFSLLVYAWRS